MALMMELGIILRTALGNLEEYRRVNDPYKKGRSKEVKTQQQNYDRSSHSMSQCNRNCLVPLILDREPSISKTSK